MEENDEQIPETEIIDVAKSKWVVFKCEGNLEFYFFIK